MKSPLLTLLCATATFLLPPLPARAEAPADAVHLTKTETAARDKFKKTTVPPAKLAGTYLGVGFAPANMLVTRTAQLTVKGEWVSGSLLDARPGQFIRDGVKSTFTNSDVTTDDKNEGTYLNLGPAKAEYVTYTDAEGQPHEGLLLESSFLEKQVPQPTPAAKKKK